MKLSIAKQLTAGLLLSMASVFANAGIIDFDDQVGFDAFKDEGTGLIWMDFDASKAPLDSFDGWSLATGTQIIDLISKIELDNSAAPYQSSFTKVAGYVDFKDDETFISRAYYLNDVTDTVFKFQYFDYNTAYSSNDRLTNVASGGLNNLGFVGGQYFQFLVKDTVDVPEPTTLAIFGLGLAGLAFRRKGTQA
jgi:hypothetical protein